MTSFMTQSPAGCTAVAAGASHRRLASVSYGASPRGSDRHAFVILALSSCSSSGRQNSRRQRAGCSSLRATGRQSRLLPRVVRTRVQPEDEEDISCVAVGVNVECFLPDDNVQREAEPPATREVEETSSSSSKLEGASRHILRTLAAPKYNTRARNLVVILLRRVRGESGASSSVATTSLDSRLQELLGLGLLVLPFALWGTAMVSTKLVLPDTSPLFVAVARLLPAGIILCGVAASRKAPLPRGAAAWLGVVLFGLVDGTLFHFLMAQGLQNTTAGLGSVIIDSQPLTVAVLAALFLGEPITTVAATGLAIGLLGLVVGLLPPTFFEASGGMGLGALLSAAGPAAWGSGESMLLVAAQSMAVGTVLARWVCKDLGVEPTMATGLHLIIGSVPLLAMSLLSEPELYQHIAQAGLPLSDVALLAYTSLFGGAVAYGVFYNAASRGNLVTLSSLTFLTPLFATVAGYLALGETLTPSQLAGGAVALVGVTLVVLGKAPASSSASGSGKGSSGAIQKSANQGTRSRSVSGGGGGGGDAFLGVGSKQPPSGALGPPDLQPMQMKTNPQGREPPPRRR